MIIMPLWLWLLILPLHLTWRATVWTLVLTLRATLWIARRIAQRQHRSPKMEEG